ncbi:AAA family ATPase [Pseudomonas sp. CCI3.2]|uniref:AAA family ATPase n=1 Tax=unclassified Pseudomonas TaxID=196821 RepID=UPI002AC99F00|nr:MULTISPECIES: AAA family ATPase [unclassified Pseudomonas]MEB0077777.1 AAA family ATPase [Pseudomonas sp. MH10out]MEB0092466.1 AAA family ATPase [Pseudomonas sp. CCI4.2]MEB0103094.1 AAA family ATPase [Pseudomonas sp. CCI3.2]MEB0122357.1 AAA family ATPase [Pseudomonas sp. CCI1.2]MEB0130783.1 AAA family ATPase [Pseudomonas sp. CCI2.4]
MLKTLAVANYRSINSLVMPLGRLNVITGPNGSGKSNLYRALRLLAETAQGGVINALAREGGLLPALARLIIQASQHCQVWVVSHASRLIAALENDPSCNPIVLEKNFGQTAIVGQGMLDAPAWHWPD